MELQTMKCKIPGIYEDLTGRRFCQRHGHSGMPYVSIIDGAECEGDGEKLGDQERISEAISEFPPVFGLRGHPGQTFRLSAKSSYVDDCDIVQLYSQRYCEDGEWRDFTKGSQIHYEYEWCMEPQLTQDQFVWIVLAWMTKSLLSTDAADKMAELRASAAEAFTPGVTRLELDDMMRIAPLVYGCTEECCALPEHVGWNEYCEKYPVIAVLLLDHVARTVHR
jgi:hypothetical protein